MTAFGKANYGAYREFSHGTSMVTGGPIPEWDKLPVHIQSAWDAAADGVALVLAECPVDEDMPGSEPQAANAIIVRDIHGRQDRYLADEWDTDGEDRLTVSRKTGESRMGVAEHAPGTWTSVRRDDAPDTTLRQLGIARRALEEIARRSPEDPRKVADEALYAIWEEGE